MISVIDIVEDTTVDGPGLRTAIYCAGCRHQCPGCQNPQTWDFSVGHSMTTEEIMKIVESDRFADVTFSGGDPMYQPEGFLELAKAIKERTDKTIWCFSGFTFEVLRNMPRTRALLEYIDVLVDGPFIQSKYDETLLFRGSSNQRLIDVKKSLESDVVVLYKPDIEIM